MDRAGALIEIAMSAVASDAALGEAVRVLIEDAGADLAGMAEAKHQYRTSEHAASHWEAFIDHDQAELPALNQVHPVRRIVAFDLTVAENRARDGHPQCMETIDQPLWAYLNRLSGFPFVLGRMATHRNRRGNMRIVCGDFINNGSGADQT